MNRGRLARANGSATKHRKKPPCATRRAEWIANPDAKTLAVEQRPRAALRLPHHRQRSPSRCSLAALYATGQDTVSAWVNGAQVLTEDPLPPYKQMPWKKFVRAEVTARLSAGANTIAIETLHYVVNPNGMATDDAPPMIATLVVEYADGSWASFASNTDWKTAIHAACTAGSRRISTIRHGSAAVVWARCRASDRNRSAIRGFRIR